MRLTENIEIGSNITSRLLAVQERIAATEQRHGRLPGSVHLLVVSKNQSIEALREAIAAGQHRFGENRLQEALPKIHELSGKGLEWHFIGALQTNKTRLVAGHFDWVHSIDRLQIARRLNDQRPASLEPLSVCIQVNISGEASKSGVAPGDLPGLAKNIATLPRLRLRGLMTLPAPVSGFGPQREAFRRLREVFEQLNDHDLRLDTLSMGMTGDMEAAIAEGSTLVRIGTAIFGPRAPGHQAVQGHL